MLFKLWYGGCVASALVTEQNRTEQRKDKTQTTLKTIDKDLDLRDQCLGIRKFKQEFKPIPYFKRDSEGNPVPRDQQAEGAARHLAQKQLKKQILAIDHS